MARCARARAAVFFAVACSARRPVTAQAVSACRSFSPMRRRLRRMRTTWRACRKRSLPTVTILTSRISSQPSRVRGNSPERGHDSRAAGSTVVPGTAGCSSPPTGSARSAVFNEVAGPGPAPTKWAAASRTATPALTTSLINCKVAGQSIGGSPGGPGRHNASLKRAGEATIRSGCGSTLGQVGRHRPPSHRCGGGRTSWMLLTFSPMFRTSCCRAALRGLTARPASCCQIGLDTRLTGRSGNGVRGGRWRRSGVRAEPCPPVRGRRDTAGPWRGRRR